MADRRRWRIARSSQPVPAAGPAQVGASARRAASAAAALAFASAAVSLYWTLGGTLLLDTVGGTVEDLARERSAIGIVLGASAAAAKVIAGALALGLVRASGATLTRRLLVRLNVLASAVLVLYGGFNVAAGGLVLAGIVAPAHPPNERALRWHVFGWDLWFLVWGVLLAVAVALCRQRAGGLPATRAGRAGRPPHTDHAGE